MQQEISVKKSEILGATLLVAGACVGGGMLALPVATGVSGFLPSVIVMVLCWLMMTATGLLYVEVNLWLGKGVHVITMAKKMLGEWAKILAWVLYLFIGYASLVAYSNASSLQMMSIAERALGIPLSLHAACALFLIVFLSMVLLGRHILGSVNTVLFFGMVGAYILLMGMGTPGINPENLTRFRLTGVSLSVPLILTAFSFQTLVPSLTPYVHAHPGYLRWAVVGGSTIALVIYILWQALVLGTVPAEGPDSLQMALIKGQPATEFLRKAIGKPVVAGIAEFFAFFAIVTSFLGISLGLFDFLADGLHIQEKGWRRLLLCGLIAIPTFIFATNFHRIFLIAMDTTGGIGDSLLNGILPVMMVWAGRYRHKLKGDCLVPGGKVVLLLIALFYVCTFSLELLQQLGLVNSAYGIETLD